MMDKDESSQLMKIMREINQYCLILIKVG
jgi:hypothetical protein